MLRSKQSEQSSPANHILPSHKMMSLALLTLSGAFLTVTLAQVSSLGSTVAYFQDPEASTNNHLEAGSLVFEITPTDDDASVAPAAEEPAAFMAMSYAGSVVGNEDYYVTTLQAPESLPAAYTVSGELDSTNPVGCEQLNLTATLSDYLYSGPFVTFTSMPMSDMGEWDFEVSLPNPPSGLAPYAVCRGAIIFAAGLANSDGTMSNTFTDQKRYTFEITNWGIPEEIAEPIVEETPLLVPEVLGEQADTVVPETPPEVVPEPVIPVETEPTHQEEPAPAAEPAVEPEPVTEEPLPEVDPLAPLSVVEEVTEEVVEIVVDPPPAVESPPVEVPSF